MDRDIHREQPALLRDCRRPRAKGEIVARLTACPSCYGALEWSPLKRLSELRPPISAVAGSSADTGWLWLQADLMTGVQLLRSLSNWFLAGAAQVLLSSWIWFSASWSCNSFVFILLCRDPVNIFMISALFCLQALTNLSYC